LSRACRLLAAAGLVAALLAAVASPALAGWSQPFDLSPPGTLDVVAPQLAVSASGAAEAAFGIEDVDTPGSAQAQAALRSAAGAVIAARPVPGAAQSLATAFAGGAAALLTGVAAPGETCCSAVQALRLSAGGTSGPAQTVLSGLTGQTLGQLLALPGDRLLAAIATEEGVWASAGGASGHFAPARRLAGPARSPQSLASAWLGGGATILAWASAPGSPGTAVPGSVTVAQGARFGAPRQTRTAVTLPAGHRVQEVGVAAQARSATIAWIDGWFDRRGDAHDQVNALDLVPHARPFALSGDGGQDSGLQFGGDPAGDQAVAWKSCTTGGACVVQIASHAPGRPFGQVRSMGSIDPGQLPSLAVGGHGQLLLAWERAGAPVAAVGSAGHVLSAAHRLSSTTYAFDITAARNSGRTGVVAWSQGTLNPSVVGAAYSG
jgi:hypothetical protein